MELIKVGEQMNVNTLTIIGNSSETKPTGTYRGYPIADGSVFVEADTAKGFMYFDDGGENPWHLM